MSGISAAELVETVNDIYLSRMFSGAAAALVVHDWFLVFGDEFETIYRSPRSMPKMLFYYIRIVTPPGVILGSFGLIDFRPALSTRVCQARIVLLIIAMTTSIWAANGLLTLRLIALYKRKRLLVWFICTFFIASHTTTFALTVISIIQWSSTLAYSPVLHLCSSLTRSPIMPAVFYAPAAFEAFVFGLTAYRAWRDAKFIGTSSAPLLTILYRDGMISFVLMAAVRAWNIWIYLTQPPSSFNMGTLLMWALNTVLTTRVYMNLVWLVRGPIIVGETNFTQDPQRATINMQAPVDPYASTFTSDGPRSRQNISRGDNQHAPGNAELGSDTPGSKEGAVE